MRTRALLAVLAGALATATGAGTASAATTTTTSSNWAGYAVHGARYTHVVGTWKIPTVSCQDGEQTYSADWIGIGGYSASSQALEQTGTELDCTASGKVSASAWTEIVPAAAKTVALKVKPGDTIAAAVTVKGHKVTLTLKDTTTHKSYSRTTTAATVDTSSAEWIVEAPSECTSDDQCQTLPLSDFATTNFTGAKATDLAGHTGGIGDGSWDATRITLVSSGGTDFVSARSGTVIGAAATSLTAGGSAFSVSYAAVPVSTSAPTLPLRTAETSLH